MFKTVFDRVSHIVYRMTRYKVTQRLLNNHLRLKLSTTFIYVNFLTNFLKIIKGPLYNVIDSACIACRLLRSAALKPAGGEEIND